MTRRITTLAFFFSVQTLLGQAPLQLKTLLQIVGTDTLGGYGYYAAGVGDMNKDGYADWAVSDSHRKLTYLYYGGKTPGTIPAKTFIGGGKIVSGDFNGDGWKDLAIAYYSTDTVFVYYGSSNMDTIPDVVLHAEHFTQPNSESFGFSMQVGDINGDGYADLIIAADQYQTDLSAPPYFIGKIYLFLGSRIGLNANASWSAQGESIAQRLGYDLAVGDVNNDGKDDILALSAYLEKQYYTLSVYLGRTDTLLTRNYFYDSRKIPGGFQEHVDCFDIDGDGVKDILLDRIQVIKGKAQLDSLPTYYIPPPFNDTSTYGSYPRVSGGGDFNGDGRKDLLLTSGFTVTGGAPGFRVYFGQKGTTPQFLAYRSFPDGYLDPLDGIASNAGDINGDGVDDILMTSSVNWPHWFGFVGIYSGDTTIVTEVKPQTAEQPTNFDLKQNYPNPFNPETVINYQLEAKSDVILKIFDSLGKEVVTLVDEKQSAGEHHVHWTGKGRQGQQVSSGIYYYRLQINNKIMTKKAVLIR